MTLSISDLIQLTSIVLSLITSTIAIVISAINLRQNSKMIEESTRPYITIYLDAITICEQDSFFIIKNFGNSPAEIINFTYDPILKSTPQGGALLNEQFDCIKNIVLAPGQSKLLKYNVTMLPVDELLFTLSYKNGRRTYTETVHMNVKNFIHIPVSRPETHIPENNARQVHTLREMVERTM